MGTNYYWKVKKAPLEPERKIHIGKSSGGWSFTFQGYRDAAATGDPKDDIVSWADWKARLTESGTIVDEYERTVPLAEFIELVEVGTRPGGTWGSGLNKRRLLNHVDEILREPRYADIWPRYRDPMQHWKDPQGYAFGIDNFS